MAEPNGHDHQRHDMSAVHEHEDAHNAHDHHAQHPGHGGHDHGAMWGSFADCSGST